MDEFDLSGPPDTLAIRAKGADMRAELKAQKRCSWDDVTMGDLVDRIGADHGLEARVGSALRSIRIPHLDQLEESDLHLLTRLARDHDAVAKQAGERLLFVPRGEVSSATGKPMSAVDVRPRDARRWHVTIADRDAYASARAHWHEPAAGRRRTETAVSGGPARTLRRTHASASEAAEAARGVGPGSSRNRAPVGRAEPRQPRRGGPGGAAAGRIPGGRGRLLDVPEGRAQAGSEGLFHDRRGGVKAAQKAN